MISEELFKKYSDHTALSEGHYAYLIDKEDFKTALIEFTKFHVEAALKEASESAKFSYEGARGRTYYNVYPLENIK